MWASVVALRAPINQRNKARSAITKLRIEADNREAEARRRALWETENTRLELHRTIDRARSEVIGYITRRYEPAISRTIQLLAENEGECAKETTEEIVSRGVDEVNQWSSDICTAVTFFVSDPRSGMMHPVMDHSDPALRTAEGFRAAWEELKVSASKGWG